MAEGAPLLREYGVKSSIEGSNPSVSSKMPAHGVSSNPKPRLILFGHAGFVFSGFPSRFLTSLSFGRKFGDTDFGDVDYKRSRIKQHHKKGQALRTETTINDTRGVGVRRLLKNLPELRRIGFAANRRLLEIA